MSASNLAIIRDTAASILVNKGGGKSLSKKGKSKKDSSKGPDQKVSEYKDVPEYQAFKAAQKGLKEALKEHKMNLKEAIASNLGKEDLRVATFLNARQRWFRTKTESQTGPPATSEISDEKTA
jgi:hypothetical protein